MTQAVTNTLNNIEQMLSAKSEIQKVSDSISSGMDKKSNFRDIFDAKVDKSSKINNDSKSEIIQNNTKVRTNSETKASVDQQTVNDVRNKDLKADSSNSSNLLSNFSEIFEQVSDEINVEQSLDLTLAKDINEIIAQLKDAVENVEEIIEEIPVTDESIDTTILEELPSVDAKEDISDLGIATDDESSKEENDRAEIKAPIESMLAYVDKTITLNKTEHEELNLEKESSLLKDSVNLLDSFETTQPEIIEFAENVAEEVNSANSKESNSVPAESEFMLDEELLKDLKIEAMASESDFSGNENLMQQQTLEEYAVKTIISQEIEPFEIKTDSLQSAQGAQQPQAKPVEVNPSRIIDQITKHLDGLHNNSKVSIVLNPESLGKVNIQLMSTKEGLTAQFTVTTQEARDVLMKGLDGLKETLASHGVGVDNVAVKVADSQKSEYSQDWTEQEGSRGGNKGQGQPNREEKEKGLFEKMMAQTTEDENGNV